MSEWLYEDARVCDCLLPAHCLREVESAQLTDGNPTHVLKKCGVCACAVHGAWYSVGQRVWVERGRVRGRSVEDRFKKQRNAAACVNTQFLPTLFPDGNTNQCAK